MPKKLKNTLKLLPITMLGIFAIKNNFTHTKHCHKGKPNPRILTYKSKIMPEET